MCWANLSQTHLLQEFGVSGLLTLVGSCSLHTSWPLQACHRRLGSTLGVLGQLISNSPPPRSFQILQAELHASSGLPLIQKRVPSPNKPLSSERQCVKKVKSLSRVLLFATPWTVAYHAPLSMGFSRQEYWSGLPFPSPEDFPDSRIKPESPTLQADALPSELPGKSASM